MNPTPGRTDIYRVAVAAICLLSASSALAAPKFKVLHAFGSGHDGGGLWSRVTLDKQGNLYGATSGGGAYKYGIVFKLTPDANGKWSETVLRNFRNHGRGGSEPNGGLILDSAGNLFGTTTFGGAYDRGTVFELLRGSGSWTEKVLHSFCLHPSCGYGGPEAGLIVDNTGNLYGTAGLVFELTRGSGGWKEKILHKFCTKRNCTDGAEPFAGVIFGPSGNLYGTTHGGGAYKAGTVYEVMHFQRVEGAGLAQFPRLSHRRAGPRG
jgi:uncharacterized repeat protein (TIGR03803 family)